MNEIRKIDENKHGKIILILSLLLLIFLIIASYSGIFIAETYARNTKSFAVQGIGQDIVNFFIIAPLLFISSILYYKGNKKAMFIWAGLLSYVIYTYVIYCFAQPFNFLFLVYCTILGLSFYSFLYFLLNMTDNPIKDWYKNEIPIKMISIFFIIIAILFYFVWLSEIIPALINNEIPQSVIENGVITNPVHVLDLTIFLPALLITAQLLLKDNKYGYLLAPILLIFIILMSLAIIGMVIVMLLKDVETDIGLAAIFIVINVMSIIITTIVVKAIEDSKS
ncbi:MAG: hypothetical protein ACP6IY_17555 [Promethearchaeia archaeon]